MKKVNTLLSKIDYEILLFNIILILKTAQYSTFSNKKTLLLVVYTIS